MNDAEQKPPLPELHAAKIDAATLAALLEDLEAFTQIEEVLVKGGARTFAPLGDAGLRAAAELLVRGEIRGFQVRYRHEGAEWRDTLLRDGEGFRLVRMATPPEVASAPPAR